MKNRNLQLEGGASVRDDGHMLWVTSGSGCCVGRFGPLFQEVLQGPNVNSALRCTYHAQEGSPTYEEWDRWCDRLESLHELEVTDIIKPSFVEDK